MEVVQVDKLNCTCCVTQRRAYGVQERSLTRTTLKKSTINCLTFDESTKQPYNDNLCLFRALALHLHRYQRLEEETLKFFNLFINKMDGLSADQFQGVHINDFPTVEDRLTLDILLYDIDIVDGNIVGELARRMCRNTETMCHC